MLITPPPATVLGKGDTFSSGTNNSSSALSVDLDEEMLQAVLLASMMEDGAGAEDSEELQKAKAAAEAQAAQQGA